MNIPFLRPEPSPTTFPCPVPLPYVPLPGQEEWTTWNVNTTNTTLSFKNTLTDEDIDRIADRVVEKQAAMSKTAASKVEVAWVIVDAKFPLGKRYWTSQASYPHWSPDSLRAVRFARRQDAEAVAGTLSFGPYDVEEHMWCSP